MATRVGPRFSIPPLPPSLSSIPSTSVWLEFTPLSALTSPKSINLGQGFPDWSPPEFLARAVPVSGAVPSAHQYARSAGHPALTASISRHYSQRIFPTQADRKIDAASEVLITVGASQALSLAISAFAGPGDEVVLIEPAFDMYTGAVLTAGATPKYVPLTARKGTTLVSSSSDLVLDMEALQNTLSEKSRLLVLNSPHNPTGKVFSRAELESIEQVLDNFPQCAVVSDEVYEHMTYNKELPHVPFASLSQNAFDRTVSVYSAGKTFSATGWKIGWAIASKEVIKRMHTLHQFTVFSVATSLQEAVATGLDEAVKPFEGFPTYYEWLAAHYMSKRDLFVTGLRNSTSLEPIVPDGAFYVLARHGSHGDTDESAEASNLPSAIRQLVEEQKLNIDPLTETRTDYNFCRRLALDKQVVGIPPSAFYDPKHCRDDLAANFVRFAFCKADSVLQAACDRMGS